jgi:hypothetical protein
MARPVWVRVLYQALLALAIRWPSCIWAFALPGLVMASPLRALGLPFEVVDYLAAALVGGTAALLAWAIVRCPWDGLVTCLSWTVAFVQFSREECAGRGELTPFFTELRYVAPIVVWGFVGCTVVAFTIRWRQRTMSQREGSRKAREAE